ncbi:hypothetical protein PybrP1_012226 [[Pythium] brassicae (nom. inval.)]|nr:hypothetical protein PybrP1_012226 [[Pythium] brassicae (nom. inval.)]
MARRTKFAGSPFEPLQLMRLDVEKLEQLADVFVRNNAAHLEQLSLARRQNVDETVWKFVKQREDIRVDSLSSNSEDGLSQASRRSHVPSDRVHSCVTCGKTQSSTGLGRVLLRDLRKRRCNLCWNHVCADCRVKKLLSHVTGGKLRRREFSFCIKCVHDSMRASAFLIAQRELGWSGSGRSPLAGGSDLFTTNQSERVLELTTPSQSDHQEQKGVDMCEKSPISP